MSDKNNIKANNDSLRGIGKLGHTEGGKMHSTLRNLSGTFSDADEVRNKPGKKEKIKCPGCGQNFKSNNGKIPKHTLKGWRAWGVPTIDGYCAQQKGRWVKPEIVKTIPSVEINEYTIEANDTIAFTTYPFKFDFVGEHELKEWVVEKIYLMDNEKIHLKLKGIEMTIPCSIFVKNFIKL